MQSAAPGMQSAAPGAAGSAEPAAPGAAECNFSLLGFFLSLADLIIRSASIASSFFFFLFFLTFEPAWSRMDSVPGQGLAAVFLVLSDLIAGYSELSMAAPWTTIASAWCNRMRLHSLLDEGDALRTPGPT